SLSPAPEPPAQPLNPALTAPHAPRRPARHLPSSLDPAPFSVPGIGPHRRHRRASRAASVLSADTGAPRELPPPSAIGPNPPFALRWSKTEEVLTSIEGLRTEKAATPLRDGGPLHVRSAEVEVAGRLVLGREVVVGRAIVIRG